MAREPSRRPLVGRDLELLLLRRWLAEADRSEPRLVEIRGAAGVGKSRLVDELIDRSGRAGARVLAGRCYEDIAIPLQPFRVALAPIYTSELAVEQNPQTAAHSDAIVSLTVARVVMEAARRRLVLLVLDDLHWADPGTMDALFHLVASAQETGGRPAPRLAVVVTTRDDEGPERIQAQMRRARREPIHRSISLRGLDEIAATELMTNLLAAPPTPSFVQAVVETTGGNPLLIESLLERMCDGGHVSVQNGHSRPTSVPAVHALPTELADAWAVRLDKLGPVGRNILEVAAVLGDGCDVGDVRTIAGTTDDEFDMLLERAADLDLLYSDGDNCRFRHPHVRRALCDALPARRRRALDTEVVAGLARRDSPDLERRALVIMGHARRATDPYSAELRRQLARSAAHQAEALGAWSLAAMCYEDVISAIDPTDPPADWCLLELRAGKAHYHNHDFAEAVPHLRRAIALARECGDLPAWGDALFFLTGAHVVQLAEGPQFDPDLVEEFLTAAGKEVPNERALVLANVAQHHFGRFNVRAAEPALDEALGIAAAGVSVETRHFIATVGGLNRLGALELDEAGECFRDAIKLIDGHEDPWQAVWVQVGVPLVDILQGRMRAAEAAAEEALASAASTHQWNLHGLAAACRAAASLAQGRIDDAEQWATTAVQSYRRSDYFYAGAVGYPHLAAARAYRGDADGARQALHEWSAVAGPVAADHAMLAAALTGDLEEARNRLEERPLLPLASSASLFSLRPALVAVEVGDLLDDHGLLEGGYAHLVEILGHDVNFGIEWCLGTARAAGVAAIQLGLFDDAHRWLTRATNNAALAESPLELARIRVARAALTRASDGSEDEIRRHLEAAVEFFDANGLGAFATHARSLAPPGALSRRSDLVICYTDIVDSTRLNVRVGDDYFLELLRDHNRVLRRRLGLYGGREFTFTGDGIGAVFGSVDAAVAFAVGVQADLDEVSTDRPDLVLRVRIGLARGDAVEDEGNLFGATVVRAVRICAAAGPGQVLLASEVSEACDPATAHCEPAGEFPLKGFGRSEALYYATTSAVGGSG